MLKEIYDQRGGRFEKSGLRVTEDEFIELGLRQDRDKKATVILFEMVTEKYRILSISIAFVVESLHMILLD